jgi:hypothetical protein
MSIFIVGFPAAVVGCLVEMVAARLARPHMMRGGDNSKFSYKK